MGGPGSGAPLGNNNRAKGKMFQAALKRVLAKKHSTLALGLEKAAEVLETEAIEKRDLDAVKEIADRIDGRATAGHEISGPGGGPIETFSLDATALSRLTDEERDNLERALPALWKLREVARPSDEGSSEEGGTEEA